MKSLVIKVLVILCIVVSGVAVWWFCFNDSIRVFVTYYKPLKSSYLALQNNQYMVPIQVGRAIEKEPFMGGELADEDILWLHERMIGDDTGDNISAKNREFDVLSAYWWVWKHYKEIGNPKYIGFFAHRKWLTVHLKGIKYVGISDDKSAEAYLSILRKHRVIAYRWDEGMRVFERYQRAHIGSDLEKMVRLIEREYPEMKEATNKVLYSDDTVQPVFNFWIMEKELAFDYFEKLFHIMFALEKEIGKEVKNRDFEQRRAYGYLAERFYGIWLERQIQLGKVEPYFGDKWDW